MNEMAGGGSVEWFTGLPTGVWYLIGVGIFCLGVWCLVMALGAMSAESDLRVRGWENRPKSTEGEGEWWAREYPQWDEEVEHG